MPPGDLVVVEVVELDEVVELAEVGATPISEIGNKQLFARFEPSTVSLSITDLCSTLVLPHSAADRVPFDEI